MKTETKAERRQARIAAMAQRIGWQPERLVAMARNVGLTEEEVVRQVRQMQREQQLGGRQ